MDNLFTLETVERLWKLLRGRALARSGGYVVLGALAIYTNVFQLLVEGGFKLFGVKLDIVETPQSVFYTLLVFGVLMLVLDRLLPVREPPPFAYPHDKQLIQNVRRAYEKVDGFMRDHDFGNPFKYERLSPLDDIIHWAGAKHRFVDIEVEQAWASFRQAVRTFMHEVDQRTVPSNVPGLLTPVFPGEDSDWHTQAMRDRYKVLNDTSNAIVEAWDKLDGLARRKLYDAI